MKKQLTHLYWLLNLRLAIKNTSFPQSIKSSIYKCFAHLDKLVKKGHKGEVTCNIGGHSFKSPTVEILQVLLREILINEQYAIDLKTDAPLIIDCGANIGCSVLYFKLKYPNARIIAIEAHPETYKVLSENVKQFKDVTVLNAFVHSVDGDKIRLYNHGAGDVIASFDAGRGGQSYTDVETVSLQKLVGGQQVDLLKMDIEGGEFAIFNQSANVDYLAHVKNVLMEYHHNLNHKPGNSFGEFLSVFEKSGFAYDMHAMVEKKAPPYFQDVFLYFTRYAK